MTLPLFDRIFPDKPLAGHKPLSGEDLKKSGMQSVYRHTPEWYRDAFRNAVESFATGRKFTVEDVRDIVGDPPKDEVSSNCMGSLMVMVAAKKLAKKTGFYVKAKRYVMHSTDLAEWIRL